MHAPKSHHFFCKKSRIIFEKLDVVMKNAEAVAKLVRITRDSLIPGNILRHVHQALARDTEHCLTLRRCEQLCFAAGKCIPAVKRRRHKAPEFLECPTVYQRASAKLRRFPGMR